MNRRHARDAACARTRSRRARAQNQLLELHLLDLARTSGFGTIRTAALDAIDEGTTVLKLVERIERLRIARRYSEIDPLLRELGEHEARLPRRPRAKPRVGQR